jgi:hypothetical protein
MVEDGARPRRPHGRCRLCTSLVRRYLHGERRRHPAHFDTQAFATVVVSLGSSADDFLGGAHRAISYCFRSRAAESHRGIWCRAGELCCEVTAGACCRYLRPGRPCGPQRRRWGRPVPPPPPSPRDTRPWTHVQGLDDRLNMVFSYAGPPGPGSGSGIASAGSYKWPPGTRSRTSMTSSTVSRSRLLALCPCPAQSWWGFRV